MSVWLTNCPETSAAVMLLMLPLFKVNALLAELPSAKAAIWLLFACNVDAEVKAPVETVMAP